MSTTRTATTRTAAAVATLAATAALLAAGAGTASATGLPKNYYWDCGSSRGATLNVTIYDDAPGRYRTDSGQEGPIPPNQPQHIPMPPGQGSVTIVALGSGPSLYDETNKVTCDRMP